jgi:hypothetical protein
MPKDYERLREAARHYAQWVVTEKRDMVAFSERDGPWLHVVPDNNNTDKSRWVHQHSDKDFNVREC